MDLTRGGGVLLAVRDVLKVEKLDLSLLLQEIAPIDVVGCKCVYRFYILYVFVIYIPKTPIIITLETLMEYFVALHLFTKNVIILGDFNIPSYSSNVDTDALNVTLNNYCDILNVKQLNQVYNVNGKLLDLVFANFKCEVNHDELPLVKEDDYHPALNICIDLKVAKQGNFPPNREFKSYNFKKANFPELYNVLSSVDWTFMRNVTSVDYALDMFYNTLYNIFDIYVPLYKQRNTQYPKWFNHDIIHIIKLKSKYHKKYISEGRIRDLNEFKRLRALAKIKIDEAYKQYMNNIENWLIAEPKSFWSFVQSKRGETRIPGRVHNNEIFYESPQSIVECFRDQFSRVYNDASDNSNSTFTNTSNLSNTLCVDIATISSSEVQAAIGKLKNKLTAGDDQVPSFLVKGCSDIFLEPLSILFNLCLQTSVFPNRWKVTRICPVHKSGDTDNVTNYRPIAILNNFAKVFERVLYDRIYSCIKCYISPFQHGFVEKRSTVSNLCCFTQYVSEYLDVQGQVDVVYTDFSKAFDRISHVILLKKLRNFGFSHSLLTIFESYLSNRQQYVFYNGHKSTCFIAKSGVPQGSNLGPLLFLLFINDICVDLNCEVLMFADDLKIFRSVNSSNDCLVLQTNINTIVSWCNKNNLHLNISKCKVMTLTKKLVPIVFPYTINDEPVMRCSITKDLGIYFDCELSFSHHIAQTVSSANKALGFVLRNCKNFNNLLVLKTLYFSLVRSRLEYGALVWQPFYENHKQLIERVQRRFLKFLWFKKHHVYPERGFAYNILLVAFDTNSLEFRRVNTGIIFLFKLVHYQIDCEYLLSKLNVHVPGVSTRNHKTFYIQKARTNIMLKSPIVIMCTNFNKICDACDIFSCTYKVLLNIVKTSFAHMM